MSFILLEFLCPTCGERFESFEDRKQPRRAIAHCPGRMSQRVISAPRVQMPFVTVERGTSQDRPATALDTRPIADGQSKSEWRKQRSEFHRARRRAEVKAGL
jgi:hypothetical protein